MRVVEDLDTRDGTKRVAIFCPGCKEKHSITVEGGDAGRNWIWNGNYEKPTFSPSLLVRSGHYVPEQEGKPCWCTYKERTGSDAPFRCMVCHSFIKDGQIEFLSDCTHELKSQTVPLPRRD